MNKTNSSKTNWSPIEKENNGAKEVWYAKNTCKTKTIFL